uniref:glutathione transferase n=2 Tax=Oryza TaxID=4527 RepID=A0A0D3HFW1_9ORYZ
MLGLFPSVSQSSVVEMAGSGDELMLLGKWPSPFVTRVELALGLKGLSYEYVKQDLVNKSELLLASNPVHKKIPVLIHNGKPVCESSIIVQYIDEAFPDAGAGAALLPADPYERAVARFWVAYVDDKFVPAWVATFRGKTEEEKAEGMKQLLAAVETLEGALKDCSKGKPFFGGDTVGIVDVALGGLISWVKATEVLAGSKIFDEEKAPLLAAWAQRFGELDVAEKVLPDVDGVVEASERKTMAGGGDELKLLGMWASPFALRAKLALSFKGLSYDYVEEDLKNKSELLLSSNPVHKKVPVLIHNGKPVCESQVIVQYIDEAFPDAGVPLLPSDPYDRAVARFWAAYIDDKLLKSWLQASMCKTEQEKAAAMKETFAAVANLEAAFKECSKGKPFFGGDAVGYVDVTLGAVIGFVRVGEALHGMRLFDASRSPLLDAWLDRFAALDAAKAVLPDTGRLAEYAKMKQAEWAAAATN